MDTVKKFLTRQEIFDKSVGGVLKQGKLAFTKEPGFAGELRVACQYREQDAHGEIIAKCAAGHLIEDDEYSLGLEGNTCHNVPHTQALYKSGVDYLHHDMVRDLQALHDLTAECMAYEDHVAALRLFAKKCAEFAEESELSAVVPVGYLIQTEKVVLDAPQYPL